MSSNFPPKLAIDKCRQLEFCDWCKPVEDESSSKTGSNGRQINSKPQKIQEVNPVDCNSPGLFSTSAKGLATNACQ